MNYKMLKDENISNIIQLEYEENNVSSPNLSIKTGKDAQGNLNRCQLNTKEN